MSQDQSVTPDFVIPADMIEREIAQAEAMVARWKRHLANLQASGAGRLRINARWETGAEAEARIQQVIDAHERALELLPSFRPA